MAADPGIAFTMGASKWDLVMKNSGQDFEWGRLWQLCSCCVQTMVVMLVRGCGDGQGGQVTEQALSYFQPRV